MRVAIVSQPEYFRCHYEDELSSEYDFADFDMRWSGKPDDFRALLEFAPDITFVFRGELLPRETLQRLTGTKVAFSSEPFPKFYNDQFHYTSDSLARFEFFSSIRDLPYDYVFHYDAASEIFLRNQGFFLSGYTPFPIARSVYRPVNSSIKWDIFFIGRSTEHRERFLGPLKRDFKFLHIAHGVQGAELVSYICSSKININLHAEAELSWEPRLQMLLACGALALSEPIPANASLRPGCEFIEVHNPDDCYAACVSALNEPDRFDAFRKAGLQAITELFCAKRFFRKLISELKGDRYERPRYVRENMRLAPFKLARKYPGFDHLLEEMKHEML